MIQNKLQPAGQGTNPSCVQQNIFKTGISYQAYRVYIATLLLLLLLTISQVCVPSLDTALPLRALVYSYQLIKLGLLTQSIRQQKLPPHMRNSAFDPAVRVALALGALQAAKGPVRRSRLALERLKTT